MDQQEFGIEAVPRDDMQLYYANHVFVTGTRNEVILTLCRVEVMPGTQDGTVVRAPVLAQVYLPHPVAEGLRDALDEQVTRLRAPEEGAQ